MSTDYSQQVAEILDALGDSPTPDQAYHATRNYDERYIAAALASLQAAGGGGGSQPVGAAYVFPFTDAESADDAKGSNGDLAILLDTGTFVQKAGGTWAVA